MAEQWLEQTEKRNRSSKTYRLYIDGQPTDRYIWEGVAGAALHYLDAEGQYQDIDPTLVPSTRSITGFGPVAWEMTENEYWLFARDELSSGVPVVRYEVGEYWAQFGAHLLEFSNALDQLSLIAGPSTTPTEASGSELRWPDCYGPGWGLRFLVGRGRMSKWLDFATALPDPPDFIVEGGDPVLQLSEVMELHRDLEVYVNGELWNRRDEVATTQEIELRSPDGEVQFVFPVATAHHEGWTAEPELETDWQPNVVGETRLKRTGSDLYISVRIPLSWFETEGVEYPFHLDATIDKQTAASGDDGGWDSGGGFDSTAGWDDVGRAQGKTHSLFARWTGLTIGAGATFSTVTTDWFGHTMTGSGVLMALYGVDENDPNAPTSQSDAEGRTRTTAKVDWDEDMSSSQWYTSPEAKSIIEELYGDYGPFSNEAVMFYLEDDGSGNGDVNVPRMWDFGLNDYGPKLHIEYSTVTGKPRSALVARDVNRVRQMGL